MSVLRREVHLGLVLCIEARGQADKDNSSSRTWSSIEWIEENKRLATDRLSRGGT